MAVMCSQHVCSQHVCSQHVCSQHVCELAELVPDLNVSKTGLLVSVSKTRLVSVSKTRLLEKLRLRRAV